MYIVTCDEVFHEGETLEEVVESFEDVYGQINEECKFYEAKEIKIKRKFEIVKE